MAVWTYYGARKRDEGIDEGATTVAYVPEKGWFWYIPQHNDMISVGVVAEGKYLTRGGVKIARGDIQAGDEQNQWIKSISPAGTPDRRLSPDERIHLALPRTAATDGLLLAGDAFAFLDPVFSSGVMLALKSGVLAADAIHEAFAGARIFPRNASPTTAGPCARASKTCASWSMRFTIPSSVSAKSPTNIPTAGQITDCLSGDVNKDFSRLWKQVQEFVPLPEPLPVGQPCCAARRFRLPCKPRGTATPQALA